jgi:hypothetical protein
MVAVATPAPLRSSSLTRAKHVGTAAGPAQAELAVFDAGREHPRWPRDFESALATPSSAACRLLAVPGRRRGTPPAFRPCGPLAAASRHHASRSPQESAMTDIEKREKTAQARAALIGAQVNRAEIRPGRSGYLVSRWGYTREFDTITPVEALLDIFHAPGGKGPAT